MNSLTYLVVPQILSVTADNASNNDTMTQELAAILKKFGGQFSRTRCFLHITNLTARSLLNEFDVKGAEGLEPADDDERELLSLAKELEEEERDAQRDAGEEVVDEAGDDSDEDDEDESWIDEVASLTEEERAAFEDEVRLVKRMLLKVREDVAWHE